MGGGGGGALGGFMGAGLTWGLDDPPEFCCKFDPAKDGRDWGPLLLLGMV